jgi:hypothetical protein
MKVQEAFATETSVQTILRTLCTIVKEVYPDEEDGCVDELNAA